jgi:hypothetical protein
MISTGSRRHWTGCNASSCLSRPHGHSPIPRAAQKQVTEELPSIFDRPTPFTMRALTFIPARKERQFAVVTVRDIQAKYLLPEEIGGERTPAMATRKPGRALVEPGPTMPHDPYGGIPSGALQQLRAGAVPHPRQRRGRRDRIGPPTAKQAIAALATSGGIFYSGPVGSRLGGYFKRLPDHHLTRLIAFVPVAHYRPRFHFSKRVEAACQVAFLPAMERRFSEAIASAR